MRKAINSISSLGIVDDDQLYLVHCYRNNENDYFLLPTTEWFDSLSYTFPTGSEVKINIKIPKYKFWLSLYNEYIKNNNFIKAAHSACMAAFFYLIKRKAQCTQTSIVRIDNKIHIASWLKLKDSSKQLCNFSKVIANFNITTWCRRKRKHHLIQKASSISDAFFITHLCLSYYWWLNVQLFKLYLAPLIVGSIQNYMYFYYVYPVVKFAN